MAEQKVIMTDPRQEDYFYQEAIKTLRTNIQFAGMDVKTILFTSCYPNEGKSDITFQLSQEIGKLGKKVLLLDADIRKSILASRYGVGKQVQGLSNYLSGQASIAEIIYRTNYENMDIIFSGSFAPNPSELLGIKNNVTYQENGYNFGHFVSKYCEQENKLKESTYRFCYYIVCRDSIY